MEKMKVLSIVLDQETLDEIKSLQLRTGELSRSAILRDLIKESLKNKRDKESA